MPVATLDDSVIGTQGLSKPTPKQRAREPREPDKPKPKEVDPRQVGDDAPIRMPNPFEGKPVDSEPIEKEPEEIKVDDTEMDTKEIYRLILSPEYREITKRILTESDEGKELLAEIGVNAESAPIDNNQLSAWEIECISQLRSSLNQYPVSELEVTVHLQVSLPVQPFSFLVKR